MPRGWDWAQWIALERDHAEPTRDDEQLAKRIAEMERIIGRQRRFAWLMLLETRLILIGLTLLVLLIALLARASTNILPLGAIFAAGVALLVLFVLLVHAKLDRRGL